MKLTNTLLAIAASACTLLFAWFTDVNASWRTVTHVQVVGSCLFQHWQQTPMADQIPNDHSVSIKVDHFLVPIKGKLRFHLLTQQAGYVSIWSLGTSGKVTRLFPTAGAITVSANGSYSSQTLGFELIAQPPVGAETLLALWTRQKPHNAFTKTVCQQIQPSHRSWRCGSLEHRDWALDSQAYCLYQAS